MNLVVIDLIPALLTWEGRDRLGDPAVAPDPVGALEHLASHFALTAIADAEHTAERLRSILERENLALYFESIGTSAEFGPVVTPRVVRRLSSRLRLGLRDLVVVTGRPEVASALATARFRVVSTSQEAFNGVDEAVEELLSGRVSP